MMDDLKNKAVGKVVVDDSCYDALAKTGTDVKYGAREIKRTINREIRAALAKVILSKEFGERNVAVISHDGERFNVSIKKD